MRTPIDELNGQRLVETEAGAFALQDLSRDVAAVGAQLHLDHIAGNDAQHDEGEESDAEQGRDHEGDATGEIAEHGAAPFRS
jgi:hypothetical protein